MPANQSTNATATTSTAMTSAVLASVNPRSSVSTPSDNNQATRIAVGGPTKFIVNCNVVRAGRDLMIPLYSQQRQAAMFLMQS